MGLFDKKYCDICGGKIGLLGNRKLEDGNMCKNCAKQLSPWFSDRRHTDIAGIKEQLDYREENKNDVADFHVTYEIGEDMRVFADEDMGTFMVTDADPDDFEDENPDVISFDDVVECNLEVEETEEELYDVDEDGDDVSYDPPRFEYSYTFHMQIVLDHPFIDEIKFDLNDTPLEIEFRDRSLFGTDEFDPEKDSEYRRYMDMADDIIDLLTGEEEEEDEEEDDVEICEDEEGKEIKVVTCPYCGGRSRLTYNGICENCGGSLLD